MGKIKTNKTQLVKNHLMTKGNITSWEAIELYSATRLSAIIYVLRDRGMRIDSHDIPHTDKYGNETTYTKYVFSK